ncbi:ABC transporter ATP-binding protein [Litoreibacter albidus]|uniref:ABC transporter ATP-binding protein n=1 Tax=Litoreibacter albidus TaxID=670155 RepID=UPI003735B4A7
MADVVLNSVVKRFGEVEVIPPLDLTIPSGSFSVLVGPSGCGKSTLLRMIAGLEETTAGTISIGGHDVTDADPSERGIAMVFQSYALYPHMSVADNIGFALKLARKPRDEIRARVKEAAEILQLEDFLDRKPKALSGGQRQRVAIGRAIVRKPKVFLFDEPLSNLDAALRGQMRIELAELHSKLGATMIYVTHDQVEAMTMADQIVVLKGGVVQQAGAPMALYDAPQNVFVGQFIGAPKMNVFPGRAVDGFEADQIGIRPEDLTPAQSGGLVNGTVVYSEHLGAETIVHVRTGDIGRVVMRLNGNVALTPGTHIAMTAAPKAVHCFDASGARMPGGTAA